ncbi:Catalase-related peroxidase [Methylobacterium crusticola]|uniref:Catalase-related peroxidase n=1 Tax=Methylobacterium crusticola TaxID=1697972 RepID=A0ABQ4R3I5_9HYPH|nr:catalase family peroxidase [Methylobacterium crusticola]GJD51714.1 Catalase-related peroxidase [Methylobacterium crusticola]
MFDDDRLPPLNASAMVLRFGIIGAVLACSVGAFAYTGGWLSPDRLTPARIVAGFEQASGSHPGFRRNHAKGLCATGTFESRGAAAQISKAALFAPGRVPLVARVAFAGGMPFVQDTPAQVRSLALRFLPEGRQEWRTGMINIPVFPVTTVRDFYDQAQAMLPDPATGKPDPAKMQAFVASHPGFAAAGALIGRRQITSGFADTTYNAIHTFRFVAADGAVTPVRWSAVPLDPVVPADATGSGADPNALFDALIARAASRPVQWRLMLTLGQPDDTIDPSKPWAPDRRQVEAGLVTLDRVVAEDGGPCTDVTYDPLVLPDGIESSGDEILAARSSTYARSLRLRDGEQGQKARSAVTPREVVGRGRQ